MDFRYLADVSTAAEAFTPAPMELAHMPAPADPCVTPARSVRFT
jgi:hypothetical protein